MLEIQRGDIVSLVDGMFLERQRFVPGNYGGAFLAFLFSLAVNNELTGACLLLLTHKPPHQDGQAQDKRQVSA